MAGWAAAAWLAVVGAGCATPAGRGSGGGAARPAGRLDWWRTELYFGAVEPRAWEQFLAECVTPRFPGGFSVFEMYGQWQGRDGGVRVVPSRQVVLLHPRDARSEQAVEGIRRDFLARFGHESVLRSTGRVRVQF
ncbi:MAG: DUF3574 domain-containing protein [Verrucomicrobiota bacterium]